MTDAERNLAMARMLGYESPRIGTIDVVYQVAPSLVRRFNCIKSGADFDAVLMWAHEQGGGAAVVVSVTLFDAIGTSMPWPDVRRAVVDAILAASG